MTCLKRAIALTVCLTWSINLFASDTASDSDYILPVDSNELKIMSYNVQNLFDTDHDEDKNDYEFLPKEHPDKSKCDQVRNPSTCRSLDWSDEKVELKIQQIVKAVNAQGVLPDILVLSEVENSVVVEQLADALGFDAFDITTSPDERGIDCAILYRKKKLTRVSYDEVEVSNLRSPTRNLSATTFKLSRSLGGGYLSVFANHWPSQGNPVAARLQVARELKGFVDDIRARYSDEDHSVILTGDFNVTDSDSPHPIDDVILNRSWSAGMSDVRDFAKQNKSPMIPKMPQATYYYGVDEVWNEFDRFFVNESLTDKQGLDVDPFSYRIHAPSILSKKNDAGESIPFRYSHKTVNPSYLGYSDHFAIVVKLKYLD